MSAPKITIRRARVVKAKDLAALILHTDPWKRMDTTMKDVRASAKAMSTARYVVAAYDGRKLVGVASLQMGFLGGAYLNLLAVHDGYRSYGIGRKLIAESERVVFKKYKNFYLCVSSFNKRAIKFYRGLGFKEIGLIRELMIRGHHEHLYRKTKGPIREPRR